MNWLIFRVTLSFRHTKALLAKLVILIGHEAMPDTKQLILDETPDGVIYQNPRVAAPEALNSWANAITGNHFEQSAPRLQVSKKENIPED